MNIKLTCSSCEQTIEYDSEYADVSINCPSCSIPMWLPKISIVNPINPPVPHAHYSWMKTSFVLIFSSLIGFFILAVIGLFQHITGGSLDNPQDFLNKWGFYVCHLGLWGTLVNLFFFLCWGVVALIKLEKKVGTPAMLIGLIVIIICIAFPPFILGVAIWLLTGGKFFFMMWED